MSDNRRSRMITEGVQRTPNRAMLRAVGFSDADFSKPIVGIANMYSNLTPCNDNLDVLGLRVAESDTCSCGDAPNLRHYYHC